MEYDNRKNAALAILSKLSRDLLEIFKNLGGCLAIPQRDLCTIMLVSTPENMKNQGIIDYLKHQRMTIKLECECDSMAIEKCLPFAFFYFMERVKWFRYGYELPPAEPEVYYDILFHGGQSMLYPLYCVLTGTPEVLPLRHNSTVTREALETFMKAFREANIEICGHPVESDQKDCQAVKSYLDVMSMQPNAKLQKEVKISRKASIPEVKKIYPKIPMKRTISSDGVPSTSEAVPKKRKRPGFGIEVD
ncbi:hypothetical protein CAEBREN_25311 [Caenorhabditis brenneri]|uniref:Uncharacterized protein n=1 Tax=Caenorhabditis brenneri TaxID=135651 RepID=G0P3K0_CAEBE|nr:hypothetical protein CAEBREN_25311 [Caenorhabditis brenneri]